MQTLVKSSSFKQDNLLINSDFARGIINQKGEASYGPVSSWTMSIDMWIYFGQLHVYPQDGKIRLYANSSNTGTSYFKQKMTNLKNGKAIAYIHVVSLSGNASVTLDAGNDITLKVGDNFVETTITDNSKTLQINLHGKGVDLYVDQIKFEEGVNFTGMPAWNHSEELNKCLGYFEVVNFSTIKRRVLDVNDKQDLDRIYFHTKTKLPSITYNFFGSVNCTLGSIPYIYNNCADLEIKYTAADTNMYAQFFIDAYNY